MQAKTLLQPCKLTSEQARTNGQKGGRTTVERYGTAHMQRTGQKGGRTTVARYGRDYMQRTGRKGGYITKKRYGQRFYRTNGRKGLEAMIARHWGGNRGRALQRLTELGLMAQDPHPENGAWQFPKRDGEPW
ncbi:MAG: hypothetical protein H0X37_19850 [Herpetosiphonaceae bacterium]|nr:hypothetical protein [Herpetosiphonaceae bacterium]